MNVIPGTARLAGTARAFSPDVRALLESSVREIAETTAAAHGCGLDFDWIAGYPPTVNHLAEADRAANVAGMVLGKDRIVTDIEPSMASEDFAFMLEEKPGAYIWLGAGQPEADGNLHNARYDFNDDLLPLGASYWARLVETELVK
jgi:hippurate hydrolase